MTDAFNQPLTVGDSVVYAGRHGSTVFFRRGKVAAIETSGVSVTWDNTSYSNTNNKTSRPNVSSKNLVKEVK